MKNNFWLHRFAYLALVVPLLASSASAWQMKQAPLMTPWAALVNTNNPLPEYPRPQMVRSNWLNLNGIWQFEPTTTNAAVPTGQTLTNEILVPYPMESAISGVMQYSEFSWYRRTFTVPSAWNGERIILHLDAVDWQATVYVNGQKVGIHQGGYDPFSYDITPYLNGGSNELIVGVFSPEDNGGQPRGKQTLYPGGIMYTSSSGIWQPAWLEPVDASGIQNLQIVPDVDNSRVRLTVNCYATSGVTVNVVVTSNSIPIASTAGDPQTELDIPVHNPNLWSPDNPFLYGLQIWAVHNGVTNDAVTSYFGMRKVSVVTTNGVPQIYLNNEPYFEMGPLDQGFWPDGIYTAPTDAALEYDLQMEKALGFNMVRKHIKVERQRWYYWADTLGLLVWQDMPTCNSYTGSSDPPPVNPIDFIAELSALVTNHWNSPCVIMWDIFNEGQGQQGSSDGVGQTNTAYLVQLVQTLDPSRLVNQASGGSYYGVGNVYDVHSYPDPGAPASTTQVPVDGEFGGIAWHLTNHLWNAAEAGTSYLLASSLDNFASLYDGYIDEAMNYKSPANGQLNAAVYTQITDVENECNGLMSYDRLLKPNMDRIFSSNQKAITGQETTATIVPTSQTVLQLWQWTTNSVPSNWYATNFNASSWSTGYAGFGTVDPGVTPNTAWTTLGYIYLRRTFNPGQLTQQQINNLAFITYHDEDVAIYINGVLAGSASGYSTAYVPVTMNAAGQAAIIPGATNVMAVSCYQSTGGQFIDVGISDVSLNADTNVPETAPTILLPPVSQSVFEGGTASFCAQATGHDLNYQWDFDGSPIAGATNNTFIITNVSASMAGDYSIVVVNDAGSATNSVTLTVVVPPPAMLQHRYSFVTNAMDSVGGANGTIVAPNGGAAATINDGLHLPGSTEGAFGYSGYVSLPSGMLTTTTNLTVECWVTQSQGNNWAEIWDFGSSGSENFALIPYPVNNNNNMEVAFTPDGSEVDLQSSILFPDNSEQYVVVTYNYGNLTGDLYLNGNLVASQVMPSASYTPGLIGGAGGTIEDMLGNDVYGDDQFSGTIYEFRIWNGVVSPLYLAVSAVAGPTYVETNLTPVSLAVTVTNYSTIPGRSLQAAVTGAFQNAVGVTVTGFVTNWTSSNPGVLTVNSTGLVTAVNTGSATVGATVNGVTGTSSVITVNGSGPIITQEPPASATLLAGAALNASVGNIGSSPFVYRWFFNNGANPISTSSDSTLSLTNLAVAQAGSYFCLLSNQYGTATSSVLNLTVISPNPYQKSLLSLNPMAYWPLNETSGTTAYDLVGGYNGTYVGGCTLAQSGPTNSFFGSSGRSVLFNGSSGYVDIPEGPFNITGPITTVAWVKLVSTPGFAGVFGHGDASWRMTVNSSAEPGANDGVVPTDATGPDGINNGNWHMIAYTYTGNTSQSANGALYVDGALVANNTITTIPSGDSLDVWIGGSPDYGTSRLINADIANAAIYPQALTAAQVQDLYSGVYAGSVILSATPSGTNIVLTWPAGTLLQAPTVLGPWTTNFTAISPYSLPMTNSEQVFRALVNP